MIFSMEFKDEILKEKNIIKSFKFITHVPIQKLLNIKIAK